MAKHNDLGRFGENLAEQFLISNKFIILEKNLWMKGGELDLIALKDKIVHIIEVKSVNSDSSIRPEENLTEEKRRHLIPASLEYMKSIERRGYTRFQIDLLCVFINTVERKAFVRMIKNI